jgi:O-antigen ligase
VAAWSRRARTRNQEPLFAESRCDIYRNGFSFAPVISRSQTEIAPTIGAEGSNVKTAGALSRVSDVLCGILFAASFAVIQALIGGTRLLFSLPAYGLLAVAAVLSALSIRQSRPQPNRICLLSSAIFFGYILVRAALSPVDYLARPDTYSVLGCLLVYLFVACVFTSARQRTWFLFFLLAIAIVHVCIGALQFRDGNNFMLIPFLQRFDYGRRASGLYVCPNHLAGLLEILGIFGLSIACWARWPVWVKLLAVYGAGVCYLGVLLSASRGGFVSSAASFVIFIALTLWALRKTGRQLFIKIGGAVLAVVAVIFIIGDIYSNKMLYLNDRIWTANQEANDNRIDLWKAAVQQFKLEPIVGTGSGTYLFYGRQFRSERTASDPVVVHNDYLHLLAEYGIVGAAGFLIFFGTHVFSGWKNFQRLGPRRLAVSTRLLSNNLALQIGALSAIGAYVVHSALDFNLHIPANALLLAFVFGLIANPGISRASEPEVLTKFAIASRIALVGLGIIAAIQCVRLLPAEYFTERARVALRDNDPTTSASFAIRALKLEQKNPNIYYYLGRAGMLEGNAAADPEKRAALFQVAMVAFEKGWALARQDDTFPIELAFLYDALGRFPEAEWMYDEAIRLDPKSAPTRQSYQAHLEKWRQTGGAQQQNVDLNPK